MRSISAPTSGFTRLLWIAAPVVAIACGDSTAPPSATHLAFEVGPGTSLAGELMVPGVSVAVLDDANNRVTTATNSITLSLATNPSNGTLSGTITAAAVNGVATFPNLRVNLATTGYTLSATSPGLTGATSAPFSVLPGPAVRLAFVVQPASTIARTTLPTVSVAVQDAAGNTVTTATALIGLNIGSNPGDASLSGTAVAQTVNGVATFSDLTISKPGTGYTLVAFANGLIGATSGAFNQTVGAAAQVAFNQQPAASRPGAVMTPSFTVEVQDASGNTIPTATNSITVAIGANAGSGALSGTTTVSAVNGVATFANLSINNPAAYTLVATAANLTAGTSRLFYVRNALAFTSVTAGYFHTCGIVAGGAAYCWGDNGTGQLGAPGWPSTNAPVPVSIQTLFTGLGAGRNHTCGVNTSGVAYCWGYNADGRLGVPVGAAQSSPVAVSGGLTFSAAIAGYAHTCGVTTAGAAYCWGDNASGEIGNNSLAGSAAPAAVSGGFTFTSISVGRFFTCGLTSTAAPYCWGDNFFGQLGDGTATKRTVPSRVSTVLDFATVSAGGFHTCGLTTAGAAYCWGANDFGQLGNGTRTASSVPVAVGGSLTFAMLSVGNRHNCGVTTSGAAHCWGDNSEGHLGNGSNVTSNSPVPVSGGLTFATVSAGRFHSCGVATGGAAYCWGDNSFGELGDGTSGGRSVVPVPVR